MNAWHSFVLTVLLQLTALTLGAAIAMDLAGRRAALRHAIGVVALAMVLASPALALVLPRAFWLGSVTPVAALDRPAADRDREPQIATEAIVAQPDFPAEDAGRLPATTAPSASLSRSFTPAAVDRTDWLASGFMLAAWIWAAGALILCLRFFAVRRDLRIFARSIEQASIDAAISAEACRVLGLPQLPPVGISDLAPMPLVLGCWRPRVVLPRQLFETGSAARLRDVVIHESAHVVRRDPWINFAQHVAGVVFWPHPGVHWLGRQIARSREEVCDNFVLGGANSADYAQTLLELAEQCAGPRFALSLLGMFSRRWSLEERVAGILSPDRVKATRASRAPLAIVAILFAAACASIGGVGALAQVSKQPSAAPAPGSIVAVGVADDDAQPSTPPRPLPKIDVAPPAARPTGFPPAGATPARIVSGTVTDAAGKPVAHAQVWLPVRVIGLHEILTARTRSDDAGRFQLSVPEAWLENNSLWNGGMYIVWAYAPGHAVGRGHAGQQLNDKESLERIARDKDLKAFLGTSSNQPLVIALPAESETRLVIRSSEGKPAVGAKVLPCAYLAHPHRNYPSELSEKLLAETADANGEVRFKAVGSDHGPATFTIQLAGHGEQVFTAEVLASDGRTARFQLMPAEQRIELSPAGRIEGRIVGERLELVRGRTVLIESGPTRTAGQPGLTGVAEATIDDEGRFVIPEIAAGELRVVVKCDTRLAVQPRPPELFAVSVEAGRTLELEIPLEPCVRVHGLVRLKETGKPFAGAHVYLNPAWLHRQQTAITDEKGEYSAYVLGGDKVEVRTDDNFLSDYLQLGDPRVQHAVPRGIDDFELPAIEMARSVKVAGLLLDVDGKPLAGATIRNFTDSHLQGMGVSNATGEFTLIEVPAGTELKEIDVISGGKQLAGIIESIDPLVVRARPEIDKD